MFMGPLCNMLCGALQHYILLSKPTCPEGPCITASWCSTADDDHTLAQLLLSGRPHTNTFSPQLFFFTLHSRLYTYTDKKLPWCQSETIKSPPPPPFLQNPFPFTHCKCNTNSRICRMMLSEESESYATAWSFACLMFTMETLSVKCLELSLSA